MSRENVRKKQRIYRTNGPGTKGGRRTVSTEFFFFFLQKFCREVYTNSEMIFVDIFLRPRRVDERNSNAIHLRGKRVTCTRQYVFRGRTESVGFRSNRHGDYGEITRTSRNRRQSAIVFSATYLQYHSIPTRRKCRNEIPDEYCKNRTYVS